MDKAENPEYSVRIKDGKRVYVRRHKLQVFDIVLIVFFTLFSLLCIFPVIYELLLSFASKTDYLQASTTTIIVLPLHFNFENYKVTLYQDNIMMAFLMSMLYTVVGTVYSLILTSLGAYAFTKKGVPGLRIIFFFIIVTMFFGGGLVPFYLVVKDTVGVDNIFSVILPFGINTFNMIILRNFFNQVPDSVIDSCRLDGANEWRILFTFVLPLSKAGVATIMLYYIVAKWDDWYWPSILLANNRDLVPLALKIREGLNEGRGEGGYGGWDPSRVFDLGSNAAMVVIGLVPILAIYPFLQKYFTKGVMLGAIKS